HTRFDCDWSSDVCSSDLIGLIGVLLAPLTIQGQDSQAALATVPQIAVTGRGEVKVSPDRATLQVSVQTRGTTAAAAAAENASRRSEERRVGKGGRSRW